jgi:hypothetical protein
MIYPGIADFNGRKRATRLFYGLFTKRRFFDTIACRAKPWQGGDKHDTKEHA